jgi:hypothetical protein
MEDHVYEIWDDLPGALVGNAVPIDGSCDYKVPLASASLHLIGRDEARQRLSRWAAAEARALFGEVDDQFIVAVVDVRYGSETWSDVEGTVTLHGFACRLDTRLGTQSADLGARSDVVLLERLDEVSTTPLRLVPISNGEILAEGVRRAEQQARYEWFSGTPFAALDQPSRWTMQASAAYFTLFASDRGVDWVCALVRIFDHVNGTGLQVVPLHDEFDPQAALWVLDKLRARLLDRSVLCMWIPPSSSAEAVAVEAGFSPSEGPTCSHGNRLWFCQLEPQPTESSFA